MNNQVQPVQVTVQSAMAVMMTIWVGAFVLSRVIKVFKGEEVEAPPIQWPSSKR